MRNPSRRHVKIPLIVVLASLAISLLAACGADSGQPDGWTRYHDSKYPFQVSFPPGWHVGTFTDGKTDESTCVYVVNFVPPSSTATPSATAMISDSEGIYILINDGCPVYNSDVGPYTAKYPDSLTISGKKVTRYDWKSGVMKQFATTTFGGNCYTFRAVSPDATANHDLEVFLRMLQSFAYTGASSSTGPAQ
jgi:hypothetical protein